MKEFLIIFLSFALCMYFTLTWKLTKETTKKILTDSLTDETGRFSRISIMMFLSFNSALIMAIWEVFHNGFRYDVFVTIFSFATGTKLMDILSKKTNPVSKTSDSTASQ